MKTGAGEKKRTVGEDLVEAFQEMQAYRRGEITLEYYEVDETLLQSMSKTKKRG